MTDLSFTPPYIYIYIYVSIVTSQDSLNPQFLLFLSLYIFFVVVVGIYHKPEEFIVLRSLLLSLMGNCQAAEAATVLIQHPAENKVERIYCSVTAQQVMSSNPGHYVALLITSPTGRTHNGVPVKQLKLLRPEDTLLLGHVYRLVSFQGMT